MQSTPCSPSYSNILEIYPFMCSPSTMFTVYSVIRCSSFNLLSCFILFINSASSVLRHAKVIIFTDDMKLYLRVNSIPAASLKALYCTLLYVLFQNMVVFCGISPSHTQEKWLNESKDYFYVLLRSGIISLSSTRLLTSSIFPPSLNSC